MHFSTWSGRFFKDPVDSFFPGFVVLALAGIAIAGPWPGRRPADGDPTRARVPMLVAIRVMGVVLSLGTAIYGWLFAVFPPMQGLRAAARFGNLFLLAVAVLGGMGLARVRRRSWSPSCSSCSSTSSRCARQCPTTRSAASPP